MTQRLGEELGLEVGSTARLTALVTAMGVPADVATIRVRVKNQFGIETLPVVIRDGPGEYHADVLIDVSGQYRVRWEGDGPVSASETSFVARRSEYAIFGNDGEGIVGMIPQNQVVGLLEDLAALAQSVADEQARATAAEQALATAQEAFYTKPDNGIPKTDLTSEVQATLDLAEGTAGALDQAVANLTQETVQRAAADDALSVSISDETSRATAAEQLLGVDVNAEALTRADADSALSAAIANETTRALAAEGGIADGLAAEITARSSGDSDLQTAIDDESTTRANDDATLQAAIDAEEAARVAADTALQDELAGIGADDVLHALIVQSDSEIPLDTPDGKMIINEGMDGAPDYGIVDPETIFELAGAARSYATRTRGVHGIDDFRALVRGRHLGYDTRSQAVTFPVFNRGAQTLTNGTLFLSRVDPFNDIVATKFLIETDATASVGATLLRLGLYEIVGNQRLLRASTGDLSATALAATQTLYSPALSASYGLVRSHQYEVGIIAVGQTTAAVIKGADVGKMGTRMAKVLATQTDLPSTILTSALSDTSTLIWAGVSE